MKEETQNDKMHTLAERENGIDACLIKLMKKNKLIKHNDLIEDFFKVQTAFKPDSALIKKRIESLMEREYIKRD